MGILIDKDNLHSNESNLGIIAFIGFSCQIILAIEMRLYYIYMSVKSFTPKYFTKTNHSAKSCLKSA